MSGRCEICRFFQPFQHPDGKPARGLAELGYDGGCFRRKFMPVKIRGTLAGFPPVSKNVFCGEFQPALQEQEDR